MTAIPASRAPTLSQPTATTAGAAVTANLAVTAVSTANRHAMPQIAAVVDQLRTIFGPVQVVFAAEGGRELGKTPDPGVIAYPLHVPNNKRKARTERAHAQPGRPTATLTR